MPNKSQERSWEWTIGVKMALIGLVGLVGLLVLGGIGYWVSDSSDQDFGRRPAGRNRGPAAAGPGLGAGGAERNAGPAARRPQPGPDRPAAGRPSTAPPTRKKGMTAEDPAPGPGTGEKAEIVRKAPGADKPVPGTKLTLADQIVGNFEDVAVLLEYELPGIYALHAGNAGLCRQDRGRWSFP